MLVKLSEDQARFLHDLIVKMKDGIVVEIARMTKEQRKLLDAAHTNIAISLGVED